MGQRQRAQFRFGGGYRSVACALACLLLAACGGDSTPKLTTEDDVTVSGARLAISQTILDGSSYGEALDGVDALIALYREKPDAVYESVEGDLTMREVVADAASDLDRYQPDMAAKLDRALEAGP